MKIFISWSGDTSRELAEALKKWLPKVLQAVNPYFTPDDIDKGTKWQGDILGSLNESSIGIICLTPENLEKPWILFEAGALSNRLDNAKVCPLLFNVPKANVKGPLSIFQLTEFIKGDFKRLISSINNQLDTKVDDSVLDETFDAFFPRLEKDVEEIIKRSHNKENRTISERPQREILEEILELVRRQSRRGDAVINILSDTETAYDNHGNLHFSNDYYKQLLNKDIPSFKKLKKEFQTDEIRRNQHIPLNFEFDDKKASE